ncbi:MAG: hypothetical protein ABII07_01010 [Patescibacteria group bacterium]|nr:hypothetical protein [Patescibacteria group bacterium]
MKLITYQITGFIFLIAFCISLWERSSFLMTMPLILIGVTHLLFGFNKLKLNKISTIAIVISIATIIVTLLFVGTLYTLDYLGNTGALVVGSLFVLISTPLLLSSLVFAIIALSIGLAEKLIKES